jgi:formate hydrogenlyase subunit 6/NADH:ubiquinone oxidoreductase subunit I
MNAYMRNIYKAVYTVMIGMRITFKQMFQPNVTHQYPYQHAFERKRNVREIHQGYRGQLDNRIEDCIGCKKCEMICPVDCISINTEKLPKGEKLWPSMNVVHLKDGTEIVGILDNEKPDADATVTIHNLTGRHGAQNVIDRQEESVDTSRTRAVQSAEIAKLVERKPCIFYMDKFDIDMSLCMYCGLCTEVCPTECLTMKSGLEGVEYSTFDRTDLIFHFAKPEMYPKTEEPEAEAAD